jgi:hypothetical protein
MFMMYAWCWWVRNDTDKQSAEKTIMLGFSGSLQPPPKLAYHRCRPRRRSVWMCRRLDAASVDESRRRIWGEPCEEERDRREKSELGGEMSDWRMGQFWHRAGRMRTRSGHAVCPPRRKPDAYFGSDAARPTVFSSSCASKTRTTLKGEVKEAWKRRRRRSVRGCQDEKAQEARLLRRSIRPPLRPDKSAL